VSATEIDTTRLAEWMDAAALPGKGEPLTARFLSGGTQNVIYELCRGDARCVLRMPPPGAPPDRDKGILREWRIIAALDGTDVPHTEAVGMCDDPSVLGRPFYLMGYVDGWSPMDQHGVWPEPFHSDPSTRAGLSYQLAEGIALLSKVDWRARGLSDLGRPEGFHERQVDRWIGFLERIKQRDLPGLAVATDWLRAHKPLDYIPGLMHGDYQFANVMYRHGAPATLAAIVDWEMGTVGDPKLDLAWMVQSWPTGDGRTGGMDGGMNYVDTRGMPARDDVVGHYADVSGRQVDDLDYYLVLA
jgi:aminoglycoside phosphotransferase (APT) family kinase protein